MKRMNLHGRCVVVTGGTSGLGRAMVEALIAAGARVAATSREHSRAQALAAELGPMALGLELDVRREESVEAAIDQACERLGGIEMLVNNAGIGMRTVTPRFLSEPPPFWLVEPDGFRAVIDVWLASEQAAGVHDQHITATHFHEWLGHR